MEKMFYDTLAATRETGHGRKSFFMVARRLGIEPMVIHRKRFWKTGDVARVKEERARVHLHRRKRNDAPARHT